MTSPHEAPPPEYSPSSPATLPGAISRLVDTDTGRYEVDTQTARYLLDLDARQLTRAPRTGPRTPGPGDPALVPGTVVRHFDVDAASVELVAIEHCVVGDEMRLRARIRGLVQPWRTTAVLRINRAGAAPTSTTPGAPPSL